MLQDYAFFVPDVATDNIWDINGSPQYRGLAVVDLPQADPSFFIENDPDNVPDLCRKLIPGQAENYTVSVVHGGVVSTLTPQIFTGGHPPHRPQ